MTDETNITEPLAFEGATIPTEDYTPIQPSWKDRVKREMSNVGAKKKVNWDSSVLKYVKDVVKEMGWASSTLCREVVSSMRLLSGHYEPVDLVIRKWDSYPEKEQKKVFSLDRACIECEVDRDEFAGLVISAVEKHIRRTGAAIIDRNWSAIIQAAVDHAIHGGKAGAAERIELIKILDRMAARERQALPVVSKPSRNSQPEPETSNGAGRSLDSQSAELDNIDNLGVE